MSTCVVRISGCNDFQAAIAGLANSQSFTAFFNNFILIAPGIFEPLISRTRWSYLKFMIYASNSAFLLHVVFVNLFDALVAGSSISNIFALSMIFNAPRPFPIGISSSMVWACFRCALPLTASTKA